MRGHELDTPQVATADKQVLGALCSGAVMTSGAQLNDPSTPETSSESRANVTHILYPKYEGLILSMSCLLTYLKWASLVIKVPVKTPPYCGVIIVHHQLHKFICQARLSLKRPGCQAEDSETTTVSIPRKELSYITVHD